VVDGIVIFVFGALVTVPAAWAIAMIVRAEHATVFARSPILIGMAGGCGFALLALPNSLVLFSGQQGIRLLPETGNAELLYITIAKWLALVIALYAGWRGGPIFPTYTAVAALAVLLDGVVGIGPDLMMVAGIAAVSAVFVKGSVPIAFVLTLYPVPLSYTGAILIGCVGAAVALAVARSADLLPTPPSHEPRPADDAGGAEPA
jgi:H+/Cl- antiporter ClcA